jgi:hypothetical protein
MMELSSLIYFFVQVRQAKKEKNKMSNRGEVISFVRGKYIGYTGWKNLDGDKTAVSIAVIVHGYKDKKNGSTSNKTATVRKESVKSKVQPAPKSRAEAIMQQHPEIEQAMEKLARQLAKCELRPRSTSIQKKLQRNYKMRPHVKLQWVTGRPGREFSTIVETRRTQCQL